MSEFEFGKELSRGVIGALLALLAAEILRSAGAGKWLAAGGSGALGSIAALALIA